MALICDAARDVLRLVEMSCVVCSAGFSYEASGPGRLRRFCSGECARRRKASLMLTYEKKPRDWSSDPYRDFVCVECSSAFRSRQYVASYCSASCQRSAVSKNLRSQALVRLEALFGPDEARIGNDGRRRLAKLRGEKVDQIAVFQRDGWRCHICLKMTRKDKRGTYHDRAPELDHIVPLSKGGAHTYANTACACRKCNQVKRDTVLGQPSLFSAA